tara:strand:+ start:637 stop:972 length:336 start_codon:yes stop_codon:yes gene_type:complete
MNEVLSFDDEAQAYAEIEAMGYHAMAFRFPAEENELHWHDFDSVLYVTSGELTVWVDGEDEPVSCGRGAKIVASGGTIHKEQTPGYSAIIGFSVMPESITQPVNKPLPVAI